MKRFLILFALLTLIFSLNAEMEYYGIKSGKVDFELTGNATGSKTIWFDNYGRKTRTEINSSTTVKMFGIENTTQEHTLTIKTDDFIYSIDLIENTGHKSENPHVDEDFKLDEMTDAERQEFYDQTLANLGGEKLGKESFLGKECEVISLMGSKSWVYKGITLKNETSLMGVNNNVTAIKLEENINIPEDSFNPPDNITWYDSYGQAGDMDIYDDYEEEEYEEDYEEMPLPGMDFDKFDSTVRNATIPEFNLFNVSSEDTMYLAVFMKTQVNSILISATYYDKEFMDDSEELQQAEKFTCKGKVAYYNQLEDGISSLSVVLENEKTVISVIKMIPTTKDDLVEIFKKFNF